MHTGSLDPLEVFVVETPDCESGQPTREYHCTCGWHTISRPEFRSHLFAGRYTGCTPRDVEIHVTDNIGVDEKVG